ncbi:ankyrin repeat domain-containing protein [Haloferula sp.]|uniref:ankyrin repeat domain-containing protein n=1 Tax=Haloferula sp. TaxID=2497595 RepID=UPI003C741794
MRRLLPLLCSLPLLATAEPDLREQLRDALYTEEVERDPAKAADAYEKILADFDQQRPLAASALFRLAEVRRSQEKNDEAIALYQRLLREFSEFESESELAREHLAALGGDLPEAGEASPETAELVRLKQLKQTSPDIFLSPETLRNAVTSGSLPPIRFLLENGADPNAEGILSQATSQGFLEVCKLLFEYGCKPDGKESANSINGALNHKNLTLLQLLFDQGLSPNAPFMMGDQPCLPLNRTIHSGDLKTADLLIERGADVNAFDRSGHNSTEGTPLHIAATDGNLAAVQLLLKHEAKPDLPSPDGAVTPLHLAIQSSKDSSLEIINLLLEKGADLKLETGDNLVWWPEREQLKSATALEIAIRTNQNDKIERLLAAGAEVTVENLRLAAWGPKPELMASLLKTRPRFESGDKAATDLLESIMKFDPRRRSVNGSHQELAIDIAPLIEHGAEPSKEWLESGLENARRGALPLLKDKFLIPGISNSDEVRLVLDELSKQRHQTLATKSDSPQLPSLASLLTSSPIHLAILSERGGPQIPGQQQDKPPVTKDQWILWQRNESNRLTPIPLDLAGDTPFPELKWGDVVERRIDHSDALTNIEFVDSLPHATYWSLLRRISFPIKITRGEEISEITVRGDCLSYDPTKPVLPLLSAGYLSQLLYPEAYYQLLSKPLEVIVHREGWDPIRLAHRTKEWETFPLQADDRISVHAPLQDEAGQLFQRKDQIRLVVPGRHFSRAHEIGHSPVLLPMLSELLTDTYGAWGIDILPGIADLPKDPQARLGKIAKIIKSGYPTPTILPHPDLAGIRIRRLRKDGSESIITPRLAESLAALTDQSTRKQLAEGDIRLQPGDIVELPLKDSTEPWSGFDEQESLYFHRLLSGAFQLVDDQGTISRNAIDWQPAKLLTSPCGPIPFQPETGTASTSAHALGLRLDSLGLRRNDDYYPFVGTVGLYIRDGDQLSLGAASPTRPPVRRVLPPSR